jgi:hypothetical protein
MCSNSSERFDDESVCNLRKPRMYLEAIVQLASDENFAVIYCQTSQGLVEKLARREVLEIFSTCTVKIQRISELLCLE